MVYLSESWPITEFFSFLKRPPRDESFVLVVSESPNNYTVRIFL